MNTLKHFISSLKTEKKCIKKMTIKNYTGDISKFLSWKEKNEIDLQRIKMEQIDIYITSLNLATASQMRHRSSLRKFFTFLKTQQLITSSPFEENQKEKQPEDIHLQEFRHYLTVYNASNLTVKYYSLDIKHFFTWLKNVRQVMTFTEAIIQDYKEYLTIHSSYSEATINRKYAAVRKYYSWLQA